MALYLSRLLSALLVIILCGVITAAFGYQAMTEQTPCPLCFLQRIAMIGVAIGQCFNFRFGIKMSHHAISIFHCLLGGAVALRQITLHICPGFPTFGTKVLGLQIYTWSFIVFVCSLIVLAILLMLYRFHQKKPKSKGLGYLEKAAFCYLLVIIVADIVTAAAICGFGICPDY
jgi:disulfide bond formation protein DsbB